jgi:hypothetical protein
MCFSGLRHISYLPFAKRSIQAKFDYPASVNARKTNAHYPFIKMLYLLNISRKGWGNKSRVRRMPIRYSKNRHGDASCKIALIIP